MVLHQCTYAPCTYETTNYAALRRHFLSHTDERPFVCPYEGCGQAFRQKPHLIDHERCKHSDEKPFACIFCEAKFKIQAQLRKHSQVHLGDPLPPGQTCFTCPLEGCNKEFMKKKQLNYHLAVHHNENLFPCTEEGCGRAFNHINCLRAHMKTHTGETFLCTYDGCEETFSRSYLLDRHLRQHARNSERPFPCPHAGCKKAFKAQNVRDKHVKRMHGVSDTGTDERCETVNLDSVFPPEFL